MKRTLTAADFEGFHLKARDRQIVWIANMKRVYKGYIPALGQKIYWERREHGMSLSEVLIKLNVDPEEHEVFMRNKKYKRYIKKAHEAAKAWWLSQIGQMALTNKGSPELLRIHLRNEFGLELDANLNDDEKFGFDVVIRKKDYDKE